VTTTRRVALGVGLAASVATAAPALAEELGVGWQGEITDDRLVEGFEVTGEVLRVPVTFEYTGPPGSVITEVTLELVPDDDRCDSRAYVQPLAVGDGDGTETPDTTTDTTAPAPPTTPDEQATVTAAWSFRVDPGCNGTYDLAAFATADPSGPPAPGDPGTESDPVAIDGLRLSLAPPPPTGVDAAAAADRTVTIRWTAPEAWTDADGAPSDARGYRIDRDAGDGTLVTVAETGPDGTSVVDDDLVTAPAGRYRYEVVALRHGASGSPVASAASEDVVELAAATTPTTGVPRAAGGVGGRSSGGARVGQPAVSPAPDFDAGFDPELDYGDSELGAPDPVLPADLEVFESDGPVGTGLLVPSAVALCLAVWAGHLRHLSRRATPPIA
jgi:hypothetical protein